MMVMFRAQQGGGGIDAELAKLSSNSILVYLTNMKSEFRTQISLELPVTDTTSASCTLIS